MELKPYSSFRPTSLDPSGLSLPDRQNWLVCPVSRTRDSDHRTESNWASQLETLGGESATVEVHRFGHWGPGWFEIVLIDPADAERVRIAEELADTLEDYPVLDEMDLSSREEAAYSACWESWAASEFLGVLFKVFELKRDTLYALNDIDANKIRELYESGIPSGDYHEDGAPTGSRMRASAERLEVADLVKWMKENRPRPYKKAS